MTKVTLGLILLMVSAVPSQAHATEEDSTDGNYLLVSCAISVRQLNDPTQEQTIDDAWRNGLCSGLVAGIMFASPSVCHAPGVTVGQGIRVVEKYLQDHPEELHLKGTRLANEGLTQAFPCKH